MFSPLKALVEVLLKGYPSPGCIVGDKEVVDGDPEAEEEQDPHGGLEAESKDDEDEQGDWDQASAPVKFEGACFCLSHSCL